MKKITVALDWTPNAVHAGLYLALLKGYYKNENLDVELLSPGVDNYEVTPIEKVFRKQVSFAIAPSETVIRSHQNGYTDLIALASVLQGAPSAFASLESSGLDSIEKLKGKKYAALDLPFEKAVIETLTNDNYQNSIPSKLDIYKMLFQGNADFVWIFKNIEKIEAASKGLDLNVFDLEENDIPYGPCTLLISNKNFISENSDEVQKFLSITALAYKEVTENWEASVDFLYEKGKLFFPDKLLLEKTVQASCSYYLNQNKVWGPMDEKRWENYIAWLEDKNELKKASVNASDLYTNDFF